MRFQRKRNVTLLLRQMELVLVELDTGAELDVTECAKIAGAELGGGTDLGSGCGRWMGRSRDRRRERAGGGVCSGGCGADERHGRICPSTVTGGAHNTERCEQRGRVDKDEPRSDGKSQDGRLSHVSIVFNTYNKTLLRCYATFIIRSLCNNNSWNSVLPSSLGSCGRSQ